MLRRLLGMTSFGGELASAKGAAVERCESVRRSRILGNDIVAYAISAQFELLWWRIY
jgi:hypothetical protein